MASEPQATVELSPIAVEDVLALPRPVAKKLAQKKRALEVHGCAEAGHRLQGPEVENICQVRVARWRVITAFASENEMWVLRVAQHLLGPEERDSESPDPRIELDAYASVFRALDLDDWPDGDPAHPDPCCDEDGRPPVDSDLIDRFMAGAEDLVAARKRERRKRQRGRR